ncbi:MAG: helix-turn-helix domain-containing protein [Clostridiales bacterium]|nr:helix-turn-helix domain-containing protein [Clostridiales bacterium]
MLSVLIAEKDEEQLRRLLGLVNWGVYGYEVKGACADGITAMEAIFRSPPDLVFTNDDLPRLGGLELIGHIQEHGILCDFVIVSETESFDTARKAMGLGVEEYLLKPVDRDEAVRVLKKYSERRSSGIGQDINERFFRTRRLLRNSFMDVFTAPDAQEQYSIEYMNQRYHIKFCEGVFQSAIILVKGAPGEENVDFLDSVITDVRAVFDPLCFEMIPFIQGRFRASFTFNYEKGSGVGEILPELFHIVREHLDRCGFENTAFCVGVGLPEYDASKLRRTLETAEYAVRCGILRGQNKLYSYGKLEFDGVASTGILTPAILGGLKNSAEALDIEGFELAVRKAFSPVSYRTDPAVLVDICRAAADAALEAAGGGDDGSGSLERKGIMERLGSETSQAGVISCIVSWAGDMFSRRLKEREYARPVREAVHYIKANCTQPLTLEWVAERVHLNTTYFCTIFKKETGQNFSDYLTDCRIGEAKRLLGGSSLKISQVCSAVGYTDYKYFSKVFKKLVGMNPSAYKALHG